MEAGDKKDYSVEGWLVKVWRSQTFPLTPSPSPGGSSQDRPPFPGSSAKAFLVPVAAALIQAPRCPAAVVQMKR